LNIVAAFGLPDGGDAAVIARRVSPGSNKGLLFHRLPEYLVKLTPSPDIWSRRGGKAFEPIPGL
jgi:hypothetical protein